LYVKVPAVVKRNWKDWLGLRIGELHMPPSATASCGIESLLVHVTVVPVATTSGFVPKAAVVSVRALLGIDTVTAELVVVGVVEGDELGVDELLHPATAERTATSRILRNVIRLLCESTACGRRSGKATAAVFV